MNNSTSNKQDQAVKAIENQLKAPWGLSRIFKRYKISSTPYSCYYDIRSCEGVNFYVLDTGVATFPGSTGDDLHGHGTHCASISAGSAYGAVEKANIVAVKVLGDSESGSKSDSIVGINWVAQNKSGIKGNVISMSTGGRLSKAQNKAINDAVDQGIVIVIVIVIVAGNDNLDACKLSPVSASKAITVGSIDSNDTKAETSNHGPCVDIHGSGVKILSAWIGSNNVTKTISDTSMATSHVSGLFTALLSQGAPSGEVEAKLKALSTPDIIQGFPANTVNLLGYSAIN